MTPDGATTSVASILFDGPTLTAKIDQLELQIAELQKQNEYLKNTAKHLRSFPVQLQGVLEQLFDDCTDRSMPDGADIDAMYDRLKELFENDSDAEVWNPEQDYDVAITYIVSVTGRVRGTSEADVKEKIHSDYLSLSIEDSGPLTDTDISWNLDSIQVDD